MACATLTSLDDLWTVDVVTPCFCARLARSYLLVSAYRRPTPRPDATVPSRRYCARCTVLP